MSELAAGIAPVTQFGRMCQKLDIKVIVARTPQAGGLRPRTTGYNNPMS